MEPVRERMGQCPLCGAEIDVLLAPSLAVVGGKVVSFCSDRCKQDFLDRSRGESGDGDDGPGTAPGADSRETHGQGTARRGTPGQGTKGRRGRGLISWLRGRSSRELSIVAVASAAVLGVVGYHLACAMRYRPAVTASAPAEAAPPREKPGAPALVQSTRHPVAVRGTTVPSPGDVLRRARSLAHELLHRDGYRLQIEAAEVLLRCCPQDAPGAGKVLMEQAVHGSWARRRLAAQALARLGIGRGREILVKDLTSPRRSVRLSAALSLARLGDKRAAPVLRSFVGARRYRLTCAEALLHLGSDKAKRILRRLVRLQSARRPDRIRAAAALAGTGDEQAARILDGLTGQGGIGWPGWLAMARAGLPGTRARLIEALRYPALRLAAARILVERKWTAGPKVWRKILWKDLSGPDEESRATAAVAALWLGMEAR